jgi:hypothetical protein
LENGSVSVLTWGGRQLLWPQPLVQWLRLPLPKGSNI